MAIALALHEAARGDKLLPASQACSAPHAARSCALPVVHLPMHTPDHPAAAGPVLAALAPTHTTNSTRGHYMQGVITAATEFAHSTCCFSRPLHASLYPTDLIVMTASGLGVGSSQNMGCASCLQHSCTSTALSKQHLAFGSRVSQAPTNLAFCSSLQVILHGDCLYII